MFEVQVEDVRSRRMLTRSGGSLIAAMTLALVTSASWAQSKPGASSSNDALTPLCTPGIAEGKSLDSGLGLYEAGDGSLIADLVDAEGAKNCLKATPANLNLNVDGVQLNLSGAVQYQAIGGPQRRIVAQTINPALCESYSTAANQFALLLSNANGDLQGANGSLGGVLSMRYTPSSGAFAPTLDTAQYGAWLTCYDATLPNAVIAPSQDSVFGARFESNGDLRVEYLDAQGAPIQSLVQTIGTDIVYKVRVSNRGEVAASGVRVREFVPKAGRALAPAMSFVSCVRDSDAVSCADTDGSLRQDVASLAPGESRTYTLTRRVIGDAPVAVESGALTSVAAFSNPDVAAEADRADNSRHLRIGLAANGIPVALAQNINTSEDTALPVVLSGSDPDSDAITGYTVTVQPTRGSLSGTAPNLTYTPNADYNGSDSFRYTVTDARGGVSSAAEVSISIAAVNDGPRVGVQLANVSYAEGASVEIDASGAFIDPEANGFTVNVTGLPSGISYFSSLRAIAGTLSLSTAGVYSVTLTATETSSGLTATQQFTLTVTNTNQNPTVATPIADQTTDEGAVVALNVAGNFADADSGDTLSFSLTAGTLPPGLTLASNGQISGTIAQTAATGSPYSVTITANDGQGGTISDVFSWTVNAVNAAPVAVGTISNRSGTVGQSFEILGSVVRGAFSDPDGDSLTYSHGSTLPPGLFMTSDGTIGGSPTAAGTYNVTITATDPGALAATQAFTITIAP